MQEGWMKTLLIRDKKAQELAGKGNKEIIKEIQTRQAIGMVLLVDCCLWVCY
jgi:hypothetical protein